MSKLTTKRTEAEENFSANIQDFEHSIDNFEMEFRIKLHDFKLQVRNAFSPQNTNE